MSSPRNSLTAEEEAAGWVLLFDGRTLDGWSPSSSEVDWKVEDGTITATRGSGHLVNSRTFGNFVLKADFWADMLVNSGIFIRCGEGAPGSQTCYEVNIYDKHETAPTGSIYTIQSVLPDRPTTTETWNTYEITADGDHLVVKLNGRTTVDVQDPKLASGRITLQEGGVGASGLIRFRNIKLRPL